MHVALLGPVELSVDRETFRLPGMKLRTIMALLTLARSGNVAKEELIDELWPHDPPRDAENALQAHIVRLRKILATHLGRARARDMLQTTGSGYRLVLAEARVDALRFGDLTAQAMRTRDIAPEQTMLLLEEALAQWRGPALLDVGDGIACRLAAIRLNEARLAAQEDLIDIKIAQGLHRSVVTDLEQIVGRHPLRERFCEQLMVALYRCGRQAEALAVYQRSQQRLAVELGLEPGLGLRSTFRRILNQDPLLDDGVLK